MPRDHNVNGIFRGFKYRNGQRTETESIVFTMRRKRAVADLHPDERIPVEIDGDPTDVLEVPLFEAPRPIPVRPFSNETLADLGATPFEFSERIRPAEPGYGIGHPDVTVGTFGLAVKWGPTDAWRIVSNNHVIANSNAAQLGDFIRQPGTYDGGTTADRIGRLEAFAKINFEGDSGKSKPRLARAFWQAIRFLGNTPSRMVGCDNRVHVGPQSIEQPQQNLVDVAVGEPTDQALISTLIAGIGQPVDIRRVTLGTLTTKKGRTTEITKLVCDGVDGTFRVQYGGGRIGAFQQTDIYVAEDGGEGSAGGDSGSAILSRDGSIWYSLLFAGGGGRTLGNQALNCASVLGNGLRLS